MSEIAKFGRVASAVCLLVIYTLIWCWVFSHVENINKNSHMEVIISRIWIGIHIIGVIIFFIWCWCN